MAAISPPPFDLICVTYLRGSAPVAADFTFFWQLVEIFDWKFKIFTFLLTIAEFKIKTLQMFQKYKNFALPAKNIQQQPKTRKQSKLGGEQKLNPLDTVSHKT